MCSLRTNDGSHLQRLVTNRRRLILLNKTRRYARQAMTMKQHGKKKKRSTSVSKTPTQGGAVGEGGDKRKVKLTPDYVVSLSKDAPPVILQSASDLAASLSCGRLQSLDESTRASVRVPKCNNGCLRRANWIFKLSVRK